MQAKKKKKKIATVSDVSEHAKPVETLNPHPTKSAKKSKGKDKKKDDQDDVDAALAELSQKYFQTSSIPFIVLISAKVPRTPKRGSFFYSKLIPFIPSICLSVQPRCRSRDA